MIPPTRRQLPVARQLLETSLIRQSHGVNRDQRRATMWQSCDIRLTFRATFSFQPINGACIIILTTIDIEIL